MLGRLFRKIAFISFVSFTFASITGASAEVQQHAIQIGSLNAVLIKPDAPRASVILMPGGDGLFSMDSDGSISLPNNNQLVRTRWAYANENLAVLVISAGTKLSQAIQYMARIKRPVTVIATSRGTLRAAEGIADGAQPEVLVLTSGFLSNESGSLDNVINLLNSPNLLPPTLVVHHRRDACPKTLPNGVDPFVHWASGRAHVIWLDGGINNGNPCRANAYHGFNGLDEQVVSTIVKFLQ